MAEGSSSKTLSRFQYGPPLSASFVTRLVLYSPPNLCVSLDSSAVLLFPNVVLTSTTINVSSVNANVLYSDGPRNPSM